MFWLFFFWKTNGKEVFMAEHNDPELRRAHKLKLKQAGVDY